VSELPDSVVGRGGSVTTHDAETADAASLELLAGVLAKAATERVPRPLEDVTTPTGMFS
jgi:hypothetical protein